MPELPEVETIVRELRKKIVGLKITDFWTDREKPLKQAGGSRAFLKEIRNKKVLSINRRAKYIVIDIEGDKTIFIHQKISGHLMYGRWKMKSEILNPKLETNSRFPPSPRLRRAGKMHNSKRRWISAISGPLKKDRENQYIRYLWTFGNGGQMAMSDLRRFSKVMLVKDADLPNLKEIKELGPEPLEIDAKKFLSLFISKRGRLKPVLMDPKFIAGIGNIYSDEILWDSGCHPLSRVENLKPRDIEKIRKSTVKILRKAINYKGDSMDDYRLPSGEKGGYQEVQCAYQQTGKKCGKNDGGTIKRIRVGGRSAHFCPKHQKLK
ncbi:MAG: hypothetical protein A3B99_03180 [Candidatus Yanofskybacteria bacterium RIFCSPHIGHO2_02_FULL_44_12b]|uniref:Uncharacterized protein n=1 Tax=Candidatus Yanofskybacteria bacterium RIFCSPLOWO2_01_FULL_44_22 TaxID=1802697 RepID=A0A1F8GMG2_9BACT|nr:MAG: hypothetical protein A2659_02955 [Candidatus Yanofskybacteria bacterium RIFCSPHIGHO2_01_FULL_44_24]OGN15074.1 MAG: hypothetical protein A3B99_03180 [Candidatus Yanofskybacteria bacterium RIFCSPHIGHO2_02_FULL_44_12b]OGN26543.1 MAG: hypothetical protein A2925_03320 [Candidatus Yanofskybacteria bacterium RIFCSPLOWO2_01_FULL_44_22]